MIEAMTRFILFDSRKLQKGIIKEANKTPKRKGFKKGAPAYKIAKVNSIKNRILLIFVRRSIDICFTRSNLDNSFLYLFSIQKNPTSEDNIIQPNY